MQGLFLRRAAEEPVQTCTITITADGYATSSYLVINGETVTAVGTYEVPVGTAIVCSVKGYSSNSEKKITINGKTVYSGTGTTRYNYTYTVVNNIVVEMVHSGSFSEVHITEE